MTFYFRANSQRGKPVLQVTVYKAILLTVYLKLILQVSLSEEADFLNSLRSDLKQHYLTILESY